MAKSLIQLHNRNSGFARRRPGHNRRGTRAGPSFCRSYWRPSSINVIPPSGRDFSDVVGLSLTPASAPQQCPPSLVGRGREGQKIKRALSALFPRQTLNWRALQASPWWAATEEPPSFPDASIPEYAQLPNLKNLNYLPSGCVYRSAPQSANSRYGAISTSCGC